MRNNEINKLVEDYKEVIAEEFVSKKFDSFMYKEKLKAEANASQGNLERAKMYLQNSLENMTASIDNVLKNSMFATNPTIYRKLKISLLLNALNSLKTKNVIFTVSPIRHLKDTAHGNQISKATLMLAIDKVIQECKWCCYFPSYEIMMDELRDYRFYAEDMCHPTQQTADYICERFLDWALPADEHDTLKVNIRAFRHGCHISK